MELRGEAALPVAFSLCLFETGCAGKAGGGEREICWQIIEFFETEELWKVEKGPGGHERKKNDHLA